MRGLEGIGSSMKTHVLADCEKNAMTEKEPPRGLKPICGQAVDVGAKSSAPKRKRQAAVKY
jgi:hypothetical protein